MNRDKGRRKEPVDYVNLLAELQKRPDRPINVLTEDQASMEGLIDLLVIKGLIVEEELTPYFERYKSAMSALVMLLITKGIITDTEMDKAVATYHFVIRNARPDATFVDILELRRDHLKKLLEA